MQSDSLVIIPTYNEKENIRAIVKAVTELEKPFDVLVIDDGSPDGTADIVKEMMEGGKFGKSGERVVIEIGKSTRLNSSHTQKSRMPSSA